MARLEDLTVGSVVNGLLPNEPITVISTKWYGSTCLDVIYKTNTGITDSQVLYRDDEPSLTVLEKSLPWSFDIPGDKMRLVSEAYRIDLAHLFDPYLAVHTSSIEPLPHQISAVYEEMLPRLPLRYVLADDPGAGKTIMTGLLLKELIVRGDLKRCMIRAFNDIDQKDKLWASYMHACVRFVEGKQMTNASLRERFGLPDSGASQISRLIKAAIEINLIKPFDPTTAPRYMRYIPIWA